MKMILQSKSLLDIWLTPEYRRLIEGDEFLSDLEKFEKLQKDKEALGTISRLHLSEPFQKLTENIPSTVEVWEILKAKGTVDQPLRQLNIWRERLWALKINDLRNVEDHIQLFNDIVEQLRENNVVTQEILLVSAAFCFESMAQVHRNAQTNPSMHTWSDIASCSGEIEILGPHQPHAECY
jgi:hypothetical protein